MSKISKDVLGKIGMYVAHHRGNLARPIPKPIGGTLSEWDWDFISNMSMSKVTLLRNAAIKLHHHKLVNLCWAYMACDTARGVHKLFGVPKDLIEKREDISLLPESNDKIL